MRDATSRKVFNDAGDYAGRVVDQGMTWQALDERSRPLGTFADFRAAVEAVLRADRKRRNEEGGR